MCETETAPASASDRDTVTVLTEAGNTLAAVEDERLHRASAQPAALT
jgi:hypothetical protein